MEPAVVRGRFFPRFVILTLLLWTGTAFAAQNDEAARNAAEKDLRIRLVGSGEGAKRTPRAERKLLPDWPVADRMVLQSGRPVGIAGTASPSCQVEVSFAGQRHRTRSDAAGRWRILLAPLKVSSEPREMVICAGGERLVLKDILVGEVWMVSGQSNMECSGNSKLYEFRTRAGFYGEQLPSLRKRIEAVAGLDEPEIRYALIRKNGFRWRKCVHRDALGCSLVALYFARKLHRVLNVPVGIVNTAYGCASIEAYLPEEELAKGNFRELLEEGRAYQDMLQKGGPAELAPAARNRLMLEHCLHPRYRFCRGLAGKDGKVDPKYCRTIEWHMSVVKPSAVHLSTVARVIGYPVCGMLWYQGETNVKETDYPLKQQLLIEAVRRLTGDPGLPFLIVMLAPNPVRELPRFWRQQFEAAATVPGTWIVNTVDTPPAEQRDYHPSSKEFIGERLAATALNRTYGMKDAVYSGPVFDRAERSGSGLLISFRHAEGLHTLDGKAPLCFEIAGADKKFVPASAVIKGERVRLSAPGVPSPKYARYAWSATNPGVNLVSGAGLPLFPFDSSDPFFQGEKHRRMNR